MSPLELTPPPGGFTEKTAVGSPTPARGVTSTESKPKVKRFSRKWKGLDRDQFEVQLFERRTRRSKGVVRGWEIGECIHCRARPEDPGERLEVVCWICPDCKSVI